jgi:ribosomal protein S18 acetylase RimI-like enzyme
LEAARLASLEDVPRLVNLATRAADEVSPQRGGQLLLASRGLPSEERWLPLLSDPRQSVWIGTCDDVVVGYAVVRAEPRRQSTVGVVEELYVEPEARSVGIGEAIMDEITAWCAARGCEGIDAVVLPGNRETKNFFETSGFAARLLVMHRPLRK